MSAIGILEDDARRLVLEGEEDLSRLCRARELGQRTEKWRRGKQSPVVEVREEDRRKALDSRMRSMSSLWRKRPSHSTTQWLHPFMRSKPLMW
jgi:hypothetical protein